MYKLFLINCHKSIANEFIALGCEVRNIQVRERDLDVPAKLDELDFEPDVIFQQEYLGCRLLLRGLNRVRCLKIFWSIDTHMNLHWHNYYACLFDCVLTTQKKYVSKLQRGSDTAVEWLPWMGIRPGPSVGTDCGIVPFGKRQFDMTFIGRVSSQRLSRQWFVDFLKSRYNLHHADNLNFSGMLETYRQTRIVPNEALFGEVNFRLFEAASCGCAVVTPNVGNELEDLFEPGREIEVYNDVLEFKEILDRLQADHGRAAAIGLAAYERVLNDHLPVARVRRILGIVSGLTPKFLSDENSELMLCLCELALGESGDSNADLNDLCRRLLALKQGIPRDTALIRLFALLGMNDEFMKVLQPYVAEQFVSSECFFNMSASLCAMRLGFWDVAKHFWYLFMRSTLGPEKVVKPNDEVHLMLLWGDQLNRCGVKIRSGVAFDEIKGIPACASDCYFAALHRRPQHIEIFKKLDALFKGVKGGEPIRLGFLSHLSLHKPDDWRLSAEVGITNLKAFRMKEGVAELIGARESARRAGQARFFDRKIELEIPLFQKLF